MGLQVKSKTTDQDKHANDVNTLLVHNEHVYSGADDGKIIKWEKNLQKVCEVVAHPCSVYSLAVLGETLYSCSNEGTLKSWTLELEPKATLLEDHDAEFWKLVVADGVLYVGDDLGTVRTVINDQVTGRHEILEGVKDMCVSGNVMFSGKDMDVTVTTIGTGPKHTFATRKVMQGRAPITIVGGTFMFVDFPATGFMVHANDHEKDYKQIVHVQGAHTMIINSLAGRQQDQSPTETKFFSGSWDKSIKLWKLNVDTQQCTAADTLDVGHVITSMVVDPSGNLYAGLAEGYLIKVVD